MYYKEVISIPAVAISIHSTWQTVTCFLIERLWNEKHVNEPLSSHSDNCVVMSWSASLVKHFIWGQRLLILFLSLASPTMREVGQYYSFWLISATEQPGSRLFHHVWRLKTSHCDHVVQQRHVRYRVQKKEIMKLSVAALDPFMLLATASQIEGTGTV